MRLMEIQRRLAAALMSSRSRGAAGLIAPNALLSPRERLEIYRRSYWSRLLDSLRDDFPGLASIVGPRALDRLFRAYLADCPSHSFTLRDLGSGLGTWLRVNPRFAAARHRLALDMVQLEWAHVVAFDSPAYQPLTLVDLAGVTDSSRLALQPHLGLLELQYPVDDIRIQCNSGPSRLVRFSKTSEPVFLAVHRQDHTVYYRRLAREEFRILSALRAGRSLARAVREDVPPRLLRDWFMAWAGFGWITARRPEKNELHA